MVTKINDRLYSWASDIDEGTILQASRTARLPIVVGHVALMSDCHFGLGATVGSVVPTKGAIVPSCVGVDIGCFTGETRVPLLDGTQKTLSELTNRMEPFWVYSVNEDLQVVPGRARAVRTRANADLVKVVVSGGDEVICTPDHLFMLYDGSYKRADSLNFNDSLMPLYRRWQTRDGYEKAHNGRRGGQTKPTHVAVWEYFNGPTPENHVVHHIDVNHFNNDPSNLKLMEKGDHSRLHREKGHKFNNLDPEFQKLRRAGIQKSMENPDRLNTMIEVGTKNITEYMRNHPQKWLESVSGNGRRGAEYLVKYNTSPIDCPECGETQDNPGRLSSHKSKEHASNHKVISVEPLEQKADVFCLQVEEHHNFALAAGVFVHNCGMIAVETNLRASDLPDNMDPLLPEIERSVPAGVGKGHKHASGQASAWYSQNPHPTGLGDLESVAMTQFGTLGSGNHFFEICLDEREVVWVVLHSGSRGVGNKLAQKHIKKAKRFAQTLGLRLEDPDLAYFTEDQPEFQAYISDLLWAQNYALGNREQMMDAALNQVFRFVGTGREVDRTNCHHNFTQKENHVFEDGSIQSVWLTRKGAIKADVGDRGIIPGSMGTRSYIVKGLGNPLSYNSCSHGAGRRMSRSEAKRQFTADDLRDQMKGKTWLKNRAEHLIDEIPTSYKDIDAVMEAQEDLVEVVHTLSQILNYKG